jgi:hypothetical protein
MQMDHNEGVAVNVWMLLKGVILESLEENQEKFTNIRAS